MQTVSMQLPDEVFLSPRQSPEEFASELRLAAAMLWYSRGVVSQEKAAQIAGMDRAAFLRSLSKNKIDVLTVDFDDLKRELERG